MKSLLQICIVLVLSFYACAAPIVTKIDLTGSEFSSTCGEVGIFLSGTFHQKFESSCTTQNDGTFSCSNKFSFNFSNAKVEIGGVTYVVTETAKSISDFSSGPNGFSTYRRNILAANLIKPGTGIVHRFFTNIKCTFSNGMQTCQVFKFEMEC